MTLKSLLAASAAFMLLGCATPAGSPGDMAFADTTSAEGKLLGDYLIGSYADQLDDADARATYYRRAFERAPGDAGLGRRAVMSAITDGDFEAAQRLSETVLAVDESEPISRAVLGTQAFAQGRYAKAETYFQQTSSDVTVQVLTNILRGWNSAAAGDTDKAREQFAAIGGNGYFGILGQLQTANLEALMGDNEAATEAFELVETTALSPIETILSKARALSAAGNSAAALSQLKTFNIENGPFEIGPIARYIGLLEAGDSLGDVLGPKQQAARALTESSYGFFLRNRAPDAAEVYLQTALKLDPTHDKAKLWLGSLLENSDRSDEAMALYRSVKDSSDYVVSAKLSQANIHFANDRDDIAIALLEKTNAEHTSFITRESLGRARLIRENYAEALPIYDALVNSMSAEKIKENPEPLYFRGICHERLKQWDLAVADFKKVLEVSPDNADALNYLGYTWVDRNENLTEAFEMIRKAVRLEPNSGAIVDSLGWAHYKLGQYEEAKVQLEKAVELAPSSATIIDHLGDTYWKLGRFREAGYQWKRALEFDPTDEERESISAKLKGGLDAVRALP